MFAEVRRSLYATTSTSGFSAVSAWRADSVFAMPTRSVVCRICRCRFESSTMSSSMMPSVPTPAAAR